MALIFFSRKLFQDIMWWIALGQHLGIILMNFAALLTTLAAEKRYQAINEDESLISRLVIRHETEVKKK